MRCVEIVQETQKAAIVEKIALILRETSGRVMQNFGSHYFSHSQKRSSQMSDVVFYTQPKILYYI